MFKHEKINTGELFLGNHRGPINKEYSKLKTLRLGNVAYSITGDPLTEYPDIKPLFIDKAEYSEYDKIQMQKLKDIRRG